MRDCKFVEKGNQWETQEGCLVEGQTFRNKKKLKRTLFPEEKPSVFRDLLGKGHLPEIQIAQKLKIKEKKSIKQLEKGHQKLRRVEKKGRGG